MKVVLERESETQWLRVSARGHALVCEFIQLYASVKISVLWVQAKKFGKNSVTLRKTILVKWL